MKLSYAIENAAIRPTGPRIKVERKTENYAGMNYVPFVYIT